MKCVWHRCQKALTGKQSRFCSENCKNNFFVARRRKTLKVKAVEYKGGKCNICGYHKCIEALTFHHVSEKDFGIAFKGYTRAWEKVKKELDQCLLLCSNCHAEVHAKEDNAAPVGNSRLKNQVNSGKPKASKEAKVILSQVPPLKAGKVQRLEREFVPYLN